MATTTLTNSLGMLNKADYENVVAGDVKQVFNALNKLIAQVNSLDPTTGTILANTITEFTAANGTDVTTAMRFAALVTLSLAIDLKSPTALKGMLEIVAADSAGNTKTTITNDSQAAARTYTIPDAGADASFLMSAGNQTLAGVMTFTQAPINKGGSILSPVAAALVGNNTIFVDSSNANVLSFKNAVGAVKVVTVV